MILPAQVELLACEGFGTISSGASKTAASQRPSRNWTEASGASDLGSDPSRPVLRPESRSIMQSELRAEAAKERSAPSPRRSRRDLYCPSAHSQQGAGRGGFQHTRGPPSGGKQLTVRENLRVIDSGIAALNAHDWDRFVRLHAESVIDLNPAAPEPIKGRAALREYYEQFNRAFPDLRTQKDRSFGQGDWVCLETTSSGTHKGPLLGPGGQAIPATGKTFRMKVAGVFKLERRQITEVHEYFDLAGFMAQLGLGPR